MQNSSTVFSKGYQFSIGGKSDSRVYRIGNEQADCGEHWTYSCLTLRQLIHHRLHWWQIGVQHLLREHFLMKNGSALRISPKVRHEGNYIAIRLHPNIAACVNRVVYGNFLLYSFLRFTNLYCLIKGVWLCEFEFDVRPWVFRWRNASVKFYSQRETH